MINIELTTRVINGQITFPHQSEIENLALETIGTSEDIYFEKIPITKHLHIKYSKKEKCWVLKRNALHHEKKFKKANFNTGGSIPGDEETFNDGAGW